MGVYSLDSTIKEVGITFIKMGINKDFENCFKKLEFLKKDLTRLKNKIKSSEEGCNKSLEGEKR